MNPMLSRRTILAAGAAAAVELLSSQPAWAAKPKRRVVSWSERTAPKDVYPHDINGAVAEGLEPLKAKGWEVVTASITDPEQGVSAKSLDRTDVLIWWGHARHSEVTDEHVNRIVDRVKNGGMGFIALHSAHYSKALKAPVFGSYRCWRCNQACRGGTGRQTSVGRTFQQEAVMVFNEVFQKFIEQSPVSVMFRGTLENALAAERLDRIFHDAARRQYCHELAFSTCADLLAAVVTRTRRSVHAAYRAERERISVSVRAVYDKLAGIEPAVSEALVRETAKGLAAIVDELHVRQPGPFPGWEVRIVDGNCLAGTHHRLKELRTIGDAALPGHSLVVLNPHRELLEDVIVCEDGHANQKPLMVRLLEIAQPGQCWIADRDFTTSPLLFGFQDHGVYFVIRQHAALIGETVRVRRRVGRIATGVVYEQGLRVTGRDGRTMVLRRVTVVLDQLTRNGDLELHLLTNLPRKVRAERIAVGYLSRWQIEAAFQKLTVALRCEPNTLGYPDAALFAFCLAMVMYNTLSTVMASLRRAHPKALVASEKTKRPRKFSFYYIADEIAGVWRGMEIAIASPLWTKAFSSQRPRQMAKILLALARKVKPERFLTNPYGPQSRRKRRPMTTRGGNISTQRILLERTKT
jgi:hypothetical protein